MKAWAATTSFASSVTSAVSARLRAMRTAIMQTTVAQKVAAVATKAWAGVQAALNVVMSLNPIGLIIAGITALVAAIGACIYWFDTWGETVLECLGPIGWVIASVVRHWDSLKQAFTDGGIIGGLKRIGEVLLDALLHPVQKLLGWVAELTGWDWAKKASEWVHEVRVDHNLAEGEKKEIDPATGKPKEDKKTEKNAAPTTSPLGIGEATNGIVAKATAQSSQIKRIDITIDKVVESFTVTTNNLQQSATDIRDMVARALVDAVNDVNYAL